MNIANKLSTIKRKQVLVLDWLPTLDATDDPGRAGHQSSEMAFPEGKLKAQSIGDFVNSPLISNQIAERRNYGP
jgi:hypothetical protein